MTWRATLDDFSTTSGDSDVELTDIVGRVQEFMRKRGVKTFKLEHIKQCAACSGTGRCRCLSKPHLCPGCGGTGKA